MPLVPYKVKSLAKPRLKLLIFGRPGTGKTALGARTGGHKDLEEVMYVNIDKGLLTVRGQENLNAVDVGSGKAGSSNIINDLESVCFSIAGKKPGFENIQTLVVDGIDVAETLNLEDTSLDYKTNSGTMKRIFRMLKDLPVNVIFLCKVNVVYAHGTTTVQEIAPAVTPKVGEALMGLVDGVWYYYKDAKGDRYLLTEEKGPARAKTRNAKFQALLGTTMLVPKDETDTLGKIYDKLLEAIK